MIAEDAMDRYVIERVDERVRSPCVRVLVRSGLNPTRSMANLIAGRVPMASGHSLRNLGVSNAAAIACN